MLHSTVSMDYQTSGISLHIHARQMIGWPQILCKQVALKRVLQLLCMLLKKHQQLNSEEWDGLQLNRS